MASTVQRLCRIGSFLRYWGACIRNYTPKSNHRLERSKSLLTHRRGYRELPFFAITVPFFPVVHAFFGKSKNAEPVVKEKKNIMADIVEICDKLYEQNKINELYEMLVVHKDFDDDEILWRLCRAACDKGKHSKDANEKKELMYEAFEYVKHALTINEENFACHKWYAIMLDYVGEYEGTKQRISNAFVLKEHFKRAVELNPKDATSIYCLGNWCFVFADMPWYQQKVASVVFTAPPTSSYEEALEYFLKAEESDPGFYSMNHLMLGKTYLRLNNKPLAKLYLLRTTENSVVTADDEKAHKEAKELLATMGVKS